MTASEQNPSSSDPASTSGRASNAGEAPSPQRPAATHPQVLPQPFYSQPVYAPYNGQANQQLAYVNPAQSLPEQSSTYVVTRIVLTALSTTWGIIIIALTSVLLSEGTLAASVSWYSYAIAAASIIWNGAELITFFVRRRKGIQRGIHPGAHVALHLIFWLVAVFATLLTATVSLSTAHFLRRCQDRDDDDDDYYYYSKSYCDEYGPTTNTLSVVRALVAFFVLWGINHFVLFVLACIETHKRNTRPTAVIIQQPSAVPAAQPMYYPQQPGTQPMQFYPYPVATMPQPQPAHIAGAESRAPASNEKQPAQAQQSYAGFYAPSPGS